MLKLIIEKSFKKDIEKIKNSGHYSTDILEEIKNIIINLQNQQPIDPVYKRHSLVGKLKKYEAIHIKNDLVMVFKATQTHIILVMIGKHTKVYKKFK